MFLTPIIYSTTLNTLLWKQTDMEHECLQREQYIPICPFMVKWSKQQCKYFNSCICNYMSYIPFTYTLTTSTYIIIHAGVHAT